MWLVWSHDYLERGRKVILEEPELDRCVGVPEDRQHHYSEKDRRRISLRILKDCNVSDL